MTKSREGGHNEITDEAKRQAPLAGMTVCEYLADTLDAARAANDSDRIRKIIKAQKYLQCRNIRKRRGMK